LWTERNTILADKGSLKQNISRNKLQKKAKDSDGGKLKQTKPQNLGFWGQTVKDANRSFEIFKILRYYAEKV